MILDVDTWYGKYSFVSIDDYDNKIYKENRENYNQNILTINIKKDKIIIEKLSIYMNWIYENYCDIYSEIYEYIYRKAGYKKYTTL